MKAVSIIFTGLLFLINTSCQDSKPMVDEPNDLSVTSDEVENIVEPVEAEPMYKEHHIEIREEHVNDEFIKGCIKAINEDDAEAIEYDYRDGITEERAAILMTYWLPEQPWRMKDNFIALLMDQDKSIIGALAEHELDSPNDERAYALCILTDNWDQFDEWLDGRWDEVDPAIEAYKNSH